MSRNICARAALSLLAVSMIVGYLLPLPALPIMEKKLIFYLYELGILVSLLLVTRRRLTLVDVALAGWGWLVGIAVLLVGLLSLTPLDVWIRSLLYTIKWAIGVAAFVVGRNAILRDWHATRFKQVVALTIISLGIFILITQVEVYHIDSLQELTRFRLGHLGQIQWMAAVNPNQLGQLLAFAIALLISDNEPWFGKRFLVATGSVLLVLTFSREALLTLVIFLLLGARSKRQLTWLFFIALLLVGMGFVTISSPHDLYSEGRERIKSWFSPINSLLQSRVEVAWTPLWSIIKGSPLVGVGPDGLRYLSTSQLDEVVYNGDNMFLGTLGAYGILGLLGLLLFLLSVLRMAKRFDARGFTGKFTFVNRYMVAYMITGLIAPHFLWPYNSINALLLLIYGLAISEIQLNYATVIYT